MLLKCVFNGHDVFPLEDRLQSHLPSPFTLRAHDATEGTAPCMPAMDGGATKSGTRPCTLGSPQD